MYLQKNNPALKYLPAIFQLKSNLYLKYKDSVILCEESEIPDLYLKKMPIHAPDANSDFDWFLFDRAHIRSCLILHRMDSDFQYPGSHLEFKKSIENQVAIFGNSGKDFYLKHISPFVIKRNNVSYNAISALIWNTHGFLGESRTWQSSFNNILHESKNNQQSLFYNNTIDDSITNKSITHQENKKIDQTTKALSSMSPQSNNLIRTWKLGALKSKQNRRYSISDPGQPFRFCMTSVIDKLNAKQIQYFKDLKKGEDPVSLHRKIMLAGADKLLLFSFKMTDAGRFECVNYGIRALVWKQKSNKFLYIPDTVKINFNQNVHSIQSFCKLQGRLENGDALIFLPETIDKKSISTMLKQIDVLDNLVYKSRFRELFGNCLDKNKVAKALMIDFCYIKNMEK